ncbi:MAG: NAD(P)-binding domain-containing protein, partial [Proteobacteria bacterium]|nr:NAD(P)-binding domain-containing protein [Pseudomonadota bacterium]
ITSSGAGFNLRTESGQSIEARRVVVATGISDQAYVPTVLQSLPPELMSHTFGLADFSCYRGKHVAIIGAGSSAIEAGALVLEAGGEPHVLVREPEVIFFTRTARTRPLLQRLLQPATALGTGHRPFIVEQLPWLPYYLPDQRRERMLNGFFQPSSPWWIKDRVVGKVPISTFTSIVGAQANANSVRLTLNSGGKHSEAEFDRVIAGTGYTRNVDRVAFLDARLKGRIHRIADAPRLSANFEASVPGLYFIGPMSEQSFGPLMRFVAGARYTARALSHHLSRSRQRIAQSVMSQNAVPRTT